MWPLYMKIACIGHFSLSSTEVIGSPYANRWGVDGKGQVIAVLDTGIDRNHPFLGTSRFVANACFSTSSWNSNDQQTLCPNGEEQQFGAAHQQRIVESKAVITGPMSPE